jgi:hypothetical protein
VRLPRSRAPTSALESLGAATQEDTIPELALLPKNKALIFVLSVSLAAQVARAAAITVSTTNDSGVGSLRQAIFDAISGDTINCSVIGRITLTNGELLITKDLTIIGPGAINLAVSGNYSSRVFEIGSNVTVSISGLTIAAGVASSGGGLLTSADNLIVSNCNFSANVAAGANGINGHYDMLNGTPVCPTAGTLGLGGAIFAETAPAAAMPAVGVSR